MEVLVCTNEEIAKARTCFGKDAQTVENDVVILKNWMLQQQHLPQNPDVNFLERVLLRNKFRIEQAKKKLDNYYTLRGLHKDYYSSANANVVPSKEISVGLPLPHMSPSHERFYMWRIQDTDVDKFVFADFVKFLNLLMEVIMREDYSVGEVVIMDFKHATLDHIKKMGLTDMSKLLQLYMKAYSGRLLGLHMINAPTYITILLGVFKLLLPTKIYERIKVHKDLDSLYKVVDKKYLPKDYGGDLDSWDKMIRNLDKLFESYYTFFDSNCHNVSNENLRVGDLPQNENFGIDGTFKQLNLD